MSESSWLCKCGHWFVWTPYGGQNKPEKCPKCGAPSEDIDSLEG